MPWGWLSNDRKAQHDGCLGSPWLPPRQLNFALFHQLLFHLIISFAQKGPWLKKFANKQTAESWRESQPEKALQGQAGSRSLMSSDGEQAMLLAFLVQLTLFPSPSASSESLLYTRALSHWCCEKLWDREVKGSAACPNSFLC